MPTINLTPYQQIDLLQILEKEKKKIYWRYNNEKITKEKFNYDLDNINNLINSVEHYKSKDYIVNSQNYDTYI